MNERILAALAVMMRAQVTMFGAIRSGDSPCAKISIVHPVIAGNSVSNVSATIVSLRPSALS
jgi:hypothetical protein